MREVANRPDQLAQRRAMMQALNASGRNLHRDKDKWRAKVREVRLPWLPPEYRELYRKLRRRNVKVDGKWQKQGSAKARQIIENAIGGPLRPVRLRWSPGTGHQVQLDDQPIHLTPQQTKVLERLLMADPGVYVTSLELLEYVWDDPDQEPDYSLHIIKMRVHQLRKAGIRVVLKRGVKNGGGGGYRIPADARA